MRTLLWFKQDLRLDDHPALQAALKSDCLLPLYVFDSALVQSTSFGTRRLGVHRARFLLESLAALDSALRQCGSHLLVLYGSAEQLIPQLVSRFALDQVLTLAEIGPHERTEVAGVQRALGSVPLQQTPVNNLLRMDQMPFRLTQMPSAFSRFREQVEQRPLVFQPDPAPYRLPPLPAGSEALLQPPPSLSQLGLGEPLSVPASAFPFSGGELAGKARLHHYLWESLAVRHYQRSHNGLIGTEYSSKLSPWLANGSLSVRRVAAELHRHEAQFGRNDSTRLLWQRLLWRDFLRWSLLRHGRALFRADGLPATAGAPQGLDQRFRQWCQGRTGMPLVDANMRELAATGFISSRGRQLVASYLIKDLQQDWRHGAAWFEEHLIDHDPACNWGNWAYLAGACRDPRREQMFNVLRQARAYDPQAEYVGLWLPELRHVPEHLRHTPFVLSQAHLKALDYPRLAEIPEAWQPYLPQAA